MHSYCKTRHIQPPPIDLYLDKLARRAQVYSPSEMQPDLKRLERWMKFLNYPRKDIFAVVLALHEALLIMRHYMTWVRFFGRGNIVTMCLKRSGG
jgi:hypothetical protein